MPGRQPKRTRGRSPADKARTGRRSSRLPRPSTPDWMGDARVFIPQGYEAGYDYPLIVWLGNPGGRFDLGRTMSRLSLRNFVAVEPAAQDDRDAAVWQAIDAVSDRLSIHARRIFLVGAGEGGTEAFRIGCRHPDAFAGVVSIDGAFPLDESLFARLDEVRRLPMLLCCRGDATDDMVRRTDRTLRVFHAAGAMLAMRIYPQIEGLSRTILGDVNRWLMDEVCGPSATLQSQCTP